MFNERWQGWKQQTKWQPYNIRNVTNITEEIFAEWVDGVDSHGTYIFFPYTKRRQVEEAIRKALAELKEIDIVRGDPQTQHPSQVIVDITSLKPEGFQPTKTVLTTLAHIIIPCPCNECEHNLQYECYLNNCKCCTSECT